MVRPVDELLAGARAAIERIEPPELERAHAGGALVVDIRPERQRAEEGELGFGLVVERNVLEWRFDLLGGHSLPEVSELRPGGRRGVLGGLCVELCRGLAPAAGFPACR